MDNLTEKLPPIKVSPELKRKIRVEAAHEDQNMSDFIRDIMSEVCDKRRLERHRNASQLPQPA